ncbi:MAG: hypothetical protein BWY31_02207 [Lentisphaerae bacterium ADurb.Bin242]|nr:MAG: hypothetical protein BWY31_02207 [Lentisphaerae bacterium ADurb.Bin242]
MNYYDVFPRMVPADRSSEIRIRPRFEHAAFPNPERLNVYNVPVDGYYPDGSHRNYGWNESTRQPLQWRLEDGVLVVNGCFAGEQEQIITAEITDEKNPAVKTTREFRIYSLKEDLYALRPFKGDFHIHTTRSDGRECPAYVAAHYRQHGFDFIAVTDHRKYEPSLEAIDFWKRFDLDFHLYPGEEVHSPDNPVHIINFGASRSINDLYRADEEKYRREVKAIQDTLPAAESGLNSFPVAASEWVFDRIRENGGLAVFCHPYWYATQNVICEALTSAVFRRRKFDAFELIGGFYRHQSRSNTYQVARWAEELSRGNRFPVVGLSDSHGTSHFEEGKDKTFTDSSDRDLFDWHFTIVFSAGNSVPSIAEAVRNFRSVAVCRYGGERPNLYGDFRMVKYADFLLREYFPIQKHLCEPEGALMLAHLAGDLQAEPALKALNGRTAAFREESFRKG